MLISSLKQNEVFSLDDSDKKKRNFLIIASTVGAVVALVIIGVVIFLSVKLCKRRRLSRSTALPNR